MKSRWPVYVSLTFLILGLITTAIYLWLQNKEIKKILSVSTRITTPTTTSHLTATGTPTNGPGVAPSVSFVTPGRKAILPTSKWVPQSFNNCGPATTSMALQHFGYSVNQEAIKKSLRTNPTDSNVFTYEIAEYLKQYGVSSKLMYGGNLAMIKTLIANGFYVIIEDWLHPYEDIGHNTLIRGYDDDLGVLIADDPFVGVGVKYKYKDFDEGQWKPFNREYLPIYRKEKEELLKAIIGENWDERRMYQNSIKLNEADVTSNPKDMYAWFNLGTNYFALGNYAKAKEAFEKSKSLGWPMRMLWYQYQPVQTYNKLSEYQKALDMANLTLKTYKAFPELFLEKAIAYRGLGNLLEAKKAANTALSLAPNYEPTKIFLKSLE